MLLVRAACREPSAQSAGKFSVNGPFWAGAALSDYQITFVPVGSTVSNAQLYLPITVRLMYEWSCLGRKFPALTAFTEYTIVASLLRPTEYLSRRLTSLTLPLP